MASAALNLWFVIQRRTNVERNSAQEYNLTMTVLYTIEGSIVYGAFVFALLSLRFAASKNYRLHSDQTARYLVITVLLLQTTGGYSMLWGLKILTVSNLLGWTSKGLGYFKLLRNDAIEAITRCDSVAECCNAVYIMLLLVPSFICFVMF